MVNPTPTVGVKNYILILRESGDNDTYAIDTNAEVVVAGRALWVAGLDYADEWTGDAPDALRTGNVLRCGLVSRARCKEIIAEEGGDCDAVGPVSSLVVTDEGSLADDGWSEAAELATETAFRAQVAKWLC